MFMGIHIGPTQHCRLHNERGLKNCENLKVSKNGDRMYLCAL